MSPIITMQEMVLQIIKCLPIQEATIIEPQIMGTTVLLILDILITIIPIWIQEQDIIVATMVLERDLRQILTNQTIILLIMLHPITLITTPNIMGINILVIMEVHILHIIIINMMDNLILWDSIQNNWISNMLIIQQIQLMMKKGNLMILAQKISTVTIWMNVVPLTSLMVKLLNQFAEQFLMFKILMIKEKA
jgi:hypothetical protein